MPSQQHIQKSSFDFLNDLKENNNRDWFEANKAIYLKEHEIMIGFADELLAKMNSHDLIETPSGKKSLHRIYRDTRFSKDKIPYKNNWSGSFSRATKERRGGYYFHIEPGNTFVAGGFFGPNATDLKRVRDEISRDSSELRAVLNSKNFKETFENLKGEQLKTTPKGFNANDKAIDLLRFKQFLLVKKFTDNEVMIADFLNKMNDAFKNMRPFFDYMSEILTTDGNGNPL
jgi:uncharacterized protein (TIGR02453 family)